MKESEFQQVVIAYATLRRWRVHAERPALRKDGSWSTAIQGHRGYPDLTFARRLEVVFAELKVGRNKPTADQQKWLAALPNSYVWYPKDMDEILWRLK